ncbi:hypothetical protein BDK51DRAFT_40125 [Blyttiomyces helicus]|uniref:Uncharacterized protein n=1 Tax=Blyttiomyces helicus TaxID=388810 RepID=A0A4P9VZ99_9FUNG|nr:hypothetical protein BDK51DRAFT_40125 [Blyttiomyces helicus]|eukprot:RKO84315.1 hypothetical protein BDK51DRAFT_40125 [Blyttiomyces helicus]
MQPGHNVHDLLWLHQAHEDQVLDQELGRVGKELDGMVLVQSSLEGTAGEQDLQATTDFDGRWPPGEELVCRVGEEEALVADAVEVVDDIAIKDEGEVALEPCPKLFLQSPTALTLSSKRSPTRAPASFLQRDAEQTLQTLPPKTFCCPSGEVRLPRFRTWNQQNILLGFDGSIINELFLEDMALAFFPTLESNPNSTIPIADAMNLAAITTFNVCSGLNILFTCSLLQIGPDPDHIVPLPTDSAELTLDPHCGHCDRLAHLHQCPRSKQPGADEQVLRAVSSTPGVFEYDIFKQVLNGNCTIPFDYFLAINEPSRSII